MPPRASFDSVDQNQDGVISREEFIHAQGHLGLGGALGRGGYESTQQQPKQPPASSASSLWDVNDAEALNKQAHQRLQDVRWASNVFDSVDSLNPQQASPAGAAASGSPQARGYRPGSAMDRKMRKERNF